MDVQHALNGCFFHPILLSMESQMALCASHPNVHLHSHSYTQESKAEKETLLPPPEDVQSAPLVCVCVCVSLCVRFIYNTLSPSPLPLPVCAHLGWVAAFVFFTDFLTLFICVYSLLLHLLT